MIKDAAGKVKPDFAGCGFWAAALAFLPVMLYTVMQERYSLFGIVRRN